MNLSVLLEESGLTGRGGAAFSTATKVAATHDHRAGLIVNACDGELGARKDGWVVEHHLAELVSGASLVARRRRVRFAAHRGSATASRLAAAGLDVLEAPPRYVSSEESSLISLAHGGLARPMTKKAPFVRGGADAAGHRVRPTVVLNAETVWRIDQVARLGSHWFRAYGTALEPGPRLASVNVGAVGGLVVESEAGVPLSSLFEQLGGFGGAQNLLIGGLGGVFVDRATASGLTWSGADLAPLGGSVGPGVIEALDPDECPLDFVSRALTFAAGETAGQCGPCMFGLPALALDWSRLVARPDAASFVAVQTRAGLLPGRGACRFPDGVAGFTRSALQIFGEHLDEHASGRCRVSERGASDALVR
ncbi:MAG: NADH-ubiquinone oxidoreductase-F iron-sulfur binding region domain-containing protein [Terracoccus sp.]